MPCWRRRWPRYTSSASTSSQLLDTVKRKTRICLAPGEQPKVSIRLNVAEHRQRRLGDLAGVQPAGVLLRHGLDARDGQHPGHGSFSFCPIMLPVSLIAFSTKFRPMRSIAVARLFFSRAERDLAACQTCAGRR